MNQFADTLGLLGLLVGIFGLAYSVYEAKKNRGFKLVYQFDGYSIIRNSKTDVPDGFEASYRGKPIENLVLSKILIWNKGKASIRSTDIATSDPLMVCFTEQPDILHVKVSRATRDANGANVVIQEDHKAAIISFDFLDKSDGFVIDIWHTGSIIEPHLSGTIISQIQGIISYGKFFPQIRQPISNNDRFEVAFTKLVGSFFASSRSFSLFIMILGFLLLILSSLAYFFDEYMISLLGAEAWVDDLALAAWPAAFLVAIGLLIRFSMTNFAPRSLYDTEKQGID